MLGEVSEVSLGLRVALGGEEVADGPEDGGAQLLGLEEVGDLAPEHLGSSRVAGEQSECGLAVVGASLRDQCAIVLELKHSIEISLSQFEIVSSRIRSGARAHLLNASGELLGEEGDEALRTLLLTVVKRLGDDLGEDVECFLAC